MNTEKLRHYIERANDKGYFKWLPDKYCLHLLYWARLGKPLNLKNPRTLNEKLQWLKLHDRNPMYTDMVDKYEAKRYVAERIGEKYIIPTLGVWDRFEDIDFDTLPDQFVLKCTHDSGGLAICRDKSTFDFDRAKRILTRSLNQNYYRLWREWPYKDVRPRIIAEMYMEDGESDKGLTDYKFFYFGGEAKFIYVSRGLENHSTAEISFFDLDGKQMPFCRSDFRPIEGPFAMPTNFEEMLDLANCLATWVSCAFVRVDFYSIRGKTYFSEITFSPCGGMLPFEPETWDEKLGSWIELPI